jgi:hypothetical protein
MEKEQYTYLHPRYDKFVTVYNGLAHYFKMRDQYLFRVATEQDFLEENRAVVDDDYRYFYIPGSIVSIRTLLLKRKQFSLYPFNRQGYQRPGVELLPEYKQLESERVGEGSDNA